MDHSTSTPPSFFCWSLLLSLEFCPLTPVALFFTFSRFYFWILSTTAPTSSYSVQFCFCIQRGHFQVEHNGGDEHGIKYVHSTLLFLLCLLSLEFCPLTPRCFFFFFPSFFRQWLQTNIVRRAMVTCIDFVQRHPWSVRLLRRGHLHGTARIKPLCQNQCLSRLPISRIKYN